MNIYSSISSSSMICQKINQLYQCTVNEFCYQADFQADFTRGFFLLDYQFCKIESHPLYLYHILSQMVDNEKKRLEYRDQTTLYIKFQAVIEYCNASSISKNYIKSHLAFLFTSFTVCLASDLCFLKLQFSTSFIFSLCKNGFLQD